MIKTRLYCVFPSKAAALAAATALRDAALPEGADPASLEPLTELPKDGWLGGTYYAIDVLFGSGVLWRPTAEVDGEGNPVMEQVPGYHINGLWCGPEDTVPEALQSFRVYPETPACVFG